MKSYDFLTEGIVEDAHEMHQDHEVQMARKDCYQAAENAIALHKLLRHVSENQGIEGWVAAKITLASDYLNTVREYLEYELMNQHSEPMGSAPASVEFPIAESRRIDESKMKDLDLDLKKPPVGLTDQAFKKKYNMTKAEATSKFSAKKEVSEVAPPGAKAERMVKHIKKGYAKDGKLTPKEKSIAYATAWKAHNKGKVEEQGVAEGLNEFAPSPGFGGDDDNDKYTPQDFGKPFKSNYLGKNEFEVFCRPPAKAKNRFRGTQEPQDPSKVIKLKVIVQKYGLEWDDEIAGEDGTSSWYLDSPGAVWIGWKYGEIPLPKAMDQARNPGHIHDLVTDFLNHYNGFELQQVAKYFGFTPYGDMNEGVAEGKKKADTYHIVNKDGKPANLASYADKESAEKDRDAKHPDAEVRQVGPRGKVKGVTEMSAGSVATVVNPTPKNKAKVGTLFGGTYQREEADTPSKKRMFTKKA